MGHLLGQAPFRLAALAFTPLAPKEYSRYPLVSVRPNLDSYNIRLLPIRLLLRNPDEFSEQVVADGEAYCGKSSGLPSSATLLRESVSAK